MSKIGTWFRNWLDLKTLVLSVGVSTLWILTSDYVVHNLLGHFVSIQLLQSVKGIAFVSIFSVILAWFHQREKRAQEAIFYQNKLITLGELSASIVHEINNPLQVIGLGLDKLLIQFPEDTKLKGIISNMETSLDRLKETIEVLNRLGRNEVLDDFSAVDLKELINDAKNFLHHRFQRLGVTFEFHNIHSLSLNIQGHPGLLTHLFLNLLGNALDASTTLAPEERWIRVEVQKCAKGKVLLAIENGGRPIPEAVSDRLFEPFFTTKERGKGLGLGLALSYRIAELHHGKLWYDRSAPNPCFALELPEGL